MRNKIKQMMKKEEGFTLVELLAVIVILGIIVAIAIPAIGNVIDNADSQAEEAQGVLVEDAARLYFVNNNDQEQVTLQTLLDEGYLEVRDAEENDLPDGPFERNDYVGTNEDD